MSAKASIFISAGDPSADYPGKNLIDQLRRVCADVDVFGLGGPRMQGAGLRTLADHRTLALMGFWEIVPRYFFFRRLMNRAVAEIETAKPKAVILMDYPGFNLRLAARIRSLGIPIIYYISPQVWAWGKGRLTAIKKLVDQMLVIFPFEETFYRAHGIPAQFTGHPIVDRFLTVPDKAGCRKSLGVGENENVIGLLPGSRLQEVKRMLPVMAAAAARIGRALDSAAFVVAGVENIREKVYRSILGPTEIPVRFGQTPEIMNGADFVITSSGTATIETAFFGTPMVVIYKTGLLTYLIARRLVSLECIAMVNIVAGNRIVPELIQKQATAPAIADQVLDLLSDRARYDRMVADLQAVRAQLGTGDAARRAVAAMQEVVNLC